jgi:uncharacterized protein
MTPDERNLLTDLANKIAQTPAPPRDAEAEDFIRTSIGRRPDALYLMTQTVLIQNMALQHAQEQIRDLQQQPARASAGGSFLGQQPSGYGQPNPAPQYAAPSQYGAPPQYAAAPPQYAAPAAGSSGPGFLRGAAQTAAGVAAGALAFEGIRSLFSHPGFGGSGFEGGSGFTGGGLGSGMAPEVINNYYDSPGQERGEHLADDSQTDTDDVDDSTDAALDDADTYDDSAQTDDSYDDSDTGDSSGSGDDFS